MYSSSVSLGGKFSPLNYTSCRFSNGKALSNGSFKLLPVFDSRICCQNVIQSLELNQHREGLKENLLSFQHVCNFVHKIIF